MAVGKKFNQPLSDAHKVEFAWRPVAVTADYMEIQLDAPTGPLARLIEYDRQQKSNLVQTLRAWLDAFGDVIAASEALYVHPNTFRYRLRRLAEVGQLDLTDPEARFVAMLQLRVLLPEVE